MKEEYVWECTGMWAHDGHSALPTTLGKISKDKTMPLTQLILWRLWSTFLTLLIHKIRLPSLYHQSQVKDLMQKMLIFCVNIATEEIHPRSFMSPKSNSNTKATFPLLGYKLRSYLGGKSIKYARKFMFLW